MRIYTQPFFPFVDVPIRLPVPIIRSSLLITNLLVLIIYLTVIIIHSHFLIIRSNVFIIRFPVDATRSAITTNNLTYIRGR